MAHSARDGIRYKDVTAMPGSTLHTLLEAAKSEKDPRKSQDLLKKAETCYSDTIAKHERLTKGT